MRILRFIFLLSMFATLLILPAANRTVHSVAQQTAAADEANVAATTDATWTEGSVDLEGVSTTDDTTYSFSTKQDPTGDGLVTSPDSCKQPPLMDALAFGFDGQTNNLIPQGKPRVSASNREYET